MPRNQGRRRRRALEAQSDIGVSFTAAVNSTMPLSGSAASEPSLDELTSAVADATEDSANQKVTVNGQQTTFVGVDEPVIASGK